MNMTKKSSRTGFESNLQKYDKVIIVMNLNLTICAYFSCSSYMAKSTAEGDHISSLSTRDFSGTEGSYRLRFARGQKFNFCSPVQLLFDQICFGCQPFPAVGTRSPHPMNYWPESPKMIGMKTNKSSLVVFCSLYQILHLKK